MAAFMIGGGELFFFGHDHRAPLGTHHHLVLAIFELGLGDEALVAARRQQRRLVDEVGKIGTGEAGGAARNHLGIDVGRQRYLAHMHAQDLLAARHIGIGHRDLAAEPSGGVQDRVVGVGAGGGLVAAKMMMPSLASKPSISTSSWLSVCSRSSLPPPRPAPRCRPTASISSMKMMQGAFFFA